MGTDCRIIGIIALKCTVAQLHARRYGIADIPMQATTKLCGMIAGEGTTRQGNLPSVGGQAGSTVTLGLIVDEATVSQYGRGGIGPRLSCHEHPAGVAAGAFLKGTIRGRQSAFAKRYGPTGTGGGCRLVLHIIIIKPYLVERQGAIGSGGPLHIKTAAVSEFRISLRDFEIVQG